MSKKISAGSCNFKVEKLMVSGLGSEEEILGEHGNHWGDLFLAVPLGVVRHVGLVGNGHFVVDSGQQAQNVHVGVVGVLGQRAAQALNEPRAQLRVAPREVAGRGGERVEKVRFSRDAVDAAVARGVRLHQVHPAVQLIPAARLEQRKRNQSKKLVQNVTVKVPKQSITQSKTRWTINQSINQAINQAIDQAIDQSVLKFSVLFYRN